MRWWVDLDPRGQRKGVIHLDLDVLGPNKLIAAVGRDPDGLTIQEIVTIMSSVDKEFEIVGLTVAEQVPIVELRLQRLLKQLLSLGKK